MGFDSFISQIILFNSFIGPGLVKSWHRCSDFLLLSRFFLRNQTFPINLNRVFIYLKQRASFFTCFTLFITISVFCSILKLESRKDAKGERGRKQRDRLWNHMQIRMHFLWSHRKNPSRLLKAKNVTDKISSLLNGENSFHQLLDTPIIWLKVSSSESQLYNLHI